MSLSNLRKLILVSLVLGIATYTAIMFSFSQRLSERFGPQVRADLEWRAQRGAQELARACDVGLAVSDAEILARAFGAYAASSDVQAIAAVDASGKVVARHGQLPEPTQELFRGQEQQLREGPDYLVSWASSTIEGELVGRVALVVSTRRLAEAHALLNQASSITLLGGLAALILGVAVVSFFTRAVTLRDAQLSDYASNLERKVDERTRELDERNRWMRLVLDNVAQGFVTIDLTGVMHPEHSAIIDRWFGAPDAGMTLSQYLERHAPQFAFSVEGNLIQIGDGFLSTELLLSQILTRFSANGRSFDVAFTPVGASDNIEKVLVIVTDVTEHLARERAEQEQKELLAVFQRILIDRGSVEEFLAESKRLIGALQTESDRLVQLRFVHTLKGNSAIYGLGSLAELSHQVESDMVENAAALDDSQRAQLASSWHQALARVEALLGNSRKDRLEIGRAELKAVVDRVRAGAPSAELVRELEGWQREPVERRLEQLGRQAVALARRQGKQEPKVVIQANAIRLDGSVWATYWSAMVHAVRNAVDHGLEETPLRIAAHKPPAGCITLGAAREGGRLTISLEDDGRGIDWEQVRAKAQACSLPSATHEDLVEALFSDGFTTRRQVSDISGRGVGLAALRQAVLDVHGVIKIESKAVHGTRLRFVFDETKLQLDYGNGLVAEASTTRREREQRSAPES